MVKVLFSIGGKKFHRGEPITYEYIEDCIFEDARNVSVKLHHRVGRFVKLQFHFAAKWMLISEITFDSVIAHGNFTPEPETATAVKDQKAAFQDDKIEIPVPNHKIGEPTYLTIIVVGLTAVVVLLGCVVFVVIRRMRNRKLFRSPNSSNMGFPSNTVPHLQPEFGISEKGNAIEAYGVTEIDDCERSHGTLKSSLRSTLPLPHPGLDHLVENNEYQEPYQALKYAPYYSYSSVVMEMQDVINNSCKKYTPTPSDAYDYAVPEAGTLPLLGSGSEDAAPVNRNRISSVSSKTQRNSSRSSHNEGKKV